MKKIITSLVLLLASVYTFAQAVDSVSVTFRIDMQNQTVSGNGVHIAGNFQGWSASASALSQVGVTSVYTRTIKLAADSSFQFKFINGNAWGTDETVPVACATGGNRLVTIAKKDTILPAFCFGSCFPCGYVPPPVDSINITLQVDMQNQTVSANGVHVAGSFQGWSPSKSVMTEVGLTTVYSKTFRVAADSSFQYKFLNGNDWPFEETVPGTCGVTADLNRQAKVATKDTTLPVVCFSSCSACTITPPPVDSVNVTFRVDMQNQTVSVNGVHIAGNFQGWNASVSALTQVGVTTVYTRTIKLAADSSFQFKFINGNVWGTDESVPAGCATGGNRTATIAKKDTTLPIVCFASCSACAAPPPPVDSVNVTFQVDMQNQTVSANGVHVAGSFQGWSPSKSAMTEVGVTTVYSKTFKVAADSSFQYKFLNGNDWPFEETVPGTCGVTADLNRQVKVAAKDTILPVVCFSSCSACTVAPPPPADSVNVTLQVDMQNQTVSANGVHVAGSMQGWSPSASPMTQIGTTTVYSSTFRIPADSSFQFKFINGNAWGTDETVPLACATSGNRSATVAKKDTILPAFCFGSCFPCGFVPPPVDSVRVTFQVDMQNQTVSDSGVHIAGNFQGWSPSITKMTNSSGSIYTATVKLAVSLTYQYKFINGNAWGADETVPTACATTNNRTATIAKKDTSLPVVCFASCSACTAPPPPVDSINITLQVDMQNQTVSANGVHVAGSFQGWSPSKSQMSEVGVTTVYSLTLRVAADSSFQYKFINGNDWPFVETVPAACGVTADLNRSVTVGNNDTTLALVCFSSCTICGPKTVSNITFQVDMGNLTVSANGVHLMGSFQGWDPTGTSMIQQGNTTVYQAVVPLSAGDSIQYKFVNGNTSNDAENPPVNCTMGSTDNRLVVVPSNSYIIPVVCFASCSACTLLGTENIAQGNTIVVYPSPAKDMFTISTGANKIYQLNIFDSEGRLVKEDVLNKTTTNISLNNFSGGIYTIRLMSNEEVVVKKIMVSK